MKPSIKHSLVFGLLLVAAAGNDAQAQVRVRPDGMRPKPIIPLTPLGIYAVVKVDDIVKAQQQTNPFITTTQLNTYLNGIYTGLLNNPATSGLALQIHWDTLNPNPPSDPNAYLWDYVDDAFSSVTLWNAANPSQSPKTIQLIVSPGFNSPQWVRDQLTSCDTLFAAPPVTPASTCGMATFSHITEGGDSSELPMPWNSSYQADWKTFLTALSARYGSSTSFVSIAVAGPTASSVEILLPNGDVANQDQFGGAAISPNSMWEQLLDLNFAGKKAYLNTDQAFIDAWNDAIDAYGTIFSGVTLVLTTGDGLPNLSTTGFSTPPQFVADCAVNANMDCAAETTILSHFVDPTVGGANGKSTQTSGMEASRVSLNLDVADVKLLSQNTMTKLSTSTRILGGAQFNTSFSNFAVQEGCLKTFPPTPKDVPSGCTIAPWKNQGVVPVPCIPDACLAPGFTTVVLEKDLYTDFKDVAASDLISPEQAAYNVLELYFDGTPVALSFGGTKGKAPLNYLQIYYTDIQYATNNTGTLATIVKTDGTTVSESAQTELNLASQKLMTIAESEP